MTRETLRDVAIAVTFGLALGALMFKADGCGRRKAPPVAAAAASAQASPVASAAAPCEAVREETHPDGRRVVTTVRARPVASAAAPVAVEAAAVVAPPPAAQERASWRVGASAAWDLRALELRPSLFGAEVSRRLAGPVWLGAYARTDKTAGLTLAVEW